MVLRVGLIEQRSSERAGEMEWERQTERQRNIFHYPHLAVRANLGPVEANLGGRQGDQMAWMCKNMIA